MFILLYLVIFCFACFASSTSGLCSAFLFGSPQVYTLLVFFVLFSLLLLCLLCSTSSGLCSDFSPAPFEFGRFISCFVLFSFKFVFYVLSLTNLINLPSIPVKLVHPFCCICALFGQSVRRVLFYTVYSVVKCNKLLLLLLLLLLLFLLLLLLCYFLGPCRFWMIMPPLHFSVIWYACFATRPPGLLVYSLVPVYLLPCVPNCFSVLLVYVCYSFLAFSAVISYVFSSCASMVAWKGV